MDDEMDDGWSIAQHESFCSFERQGDGWLSPSTDEEERKGK